MWTPVAIKPAEPMDVVLWVPPEIQDDLSIDAYHTGQWDGEAWDMPIELRFAHLSVLWVPEAEWPCPAPES